jgi:FdhE protein
MSQAGAPRHDPVPIGEVARPPFARLPDPVSLFRLRAQRFAVLALDHDLAPYLRFMAGLSEAQHRVQDDLPEPDLPPADALTRAREFGMPPLDRNQFVTSPASEATLERLLALAPQIDMPEMARAGLARAAQSHPAARDAMVRAVLADSMPVEALAEHVYVAAALQVHFARMAARLDAASLVPVGDGACPACGGPPVSSMVVGWHGAHGTRFCACPLCATLWNYVRIKCTLCGSTKGIGYLGIEESGDTIKAETCDSCRGYVKVLHQYKDPDVEPIADDVATLGLDLLLRDAGYRRGSVNPFLLGY